MFVALASLKTNMATKKDYYLVSLVGLCFGVFSLFILKNIKVGPEVNFQNSVLIIAFFILFSLGALFIASAISRKIPVVFQLAKFGAVGAFNTFFDWGILNVLILLSSVSYGFTYSLFKGVSFTFAVVASYFWNKYWTFSSKSGSSRNEFIKFLIVSIIGFAINVGVASIIVNTIGPVRKFSLAQWANMGALGGTLLSLIWNFIGYKIFVFKVKYDIIK